MDSIPGGSKSSQISIKRKEMADAMMFCPSATYEERCFQLSEYIKRRTGYTELPMEIKKFLARISYEIKSRWQSSQRYKEYFQRKNMKWLDEEISLPVNYIAPQPLAGGRPEVSFEVSSERSKRRKTESLRSQVKTSSLAFATHMSLRASGKFEAAQVVKEVTATTPTRASKYRKAYRERKEFTSQLSSDHALSMLIEGKLTKRQYNVVRSMAMTCNSRIFPSYESVTEAKKRCYPERIEIRENSAKVDLQCLLDHTIRRIIAVQEDVINTLSSSQLLNLKLISKWGCDGTGLTEYKQTFQKASCSDANMFVTSFVPLHLAVDSVESKKKVIVWQNPRPSSPRYCRPIHLQLINENVDVITQEIKRVEKQINGLDFTSTSASGKVLKVRHEMLLTMINGKVCNAASANSSSLRCYLCGASAKNFNNIEAIRKMKLNESHLRFGLSTLHAWIRMFECLLHLGYRLPIMKWQVRGEEEKRVVERNKKRIQEAFKTELGLIVDKPRPGYGNTNDGNTARRFFHNSLVSSRITGIEEDLIVRFKVILLTMSCSYPIKISAFEEYAMDTARQLVKTYPWYYMPITVHKVLLHGPQVISSALLPIGMLSEEAQEARNKDIRRYREGYSRKFSREVTMEDIFHQLLISSDPYISSLRKLPKRKFRCLPEEVLALLKEPEVCESEAEGRSDSECDLDVSDSD